MNTTNKHFEALFGQWHIVIRAVNEVEAINKVKTKWNSYKDGSRKKEDIRPYINNFTVSEVKFINGFWR